MSGRARALLPKLYDLSKGGLANPQAKEFATRLSCTPGPLLGLDVGTRHIGVALSDCGRHVAFSHGAFRRGAIREDIDRMCDLIAHVQVRAAIVGMPSEALGHDNSKMQRFVRAYAGGVLQECGVEAVAFWDESFSTQLAKDAFMKRAKKRTRNCRARRKRGVDAGAAALILQDAMDALKLVQ